MLRSSTDTTTTTTAAEDLRRNLSSPVTAAILVALLDGPLDVKEIARRVEELTGREVSPRNIYRYLYYYQQKGWVTRHSPLWSLTEIGYSLVDKYSRTIARLLSIPLESIASGRNRKKSELIGTSRKKSEDSLQQSKLCSTREKFQRIAGGLDEEEQEVLVALVEHKCKWGSNYRYFDELLEELKMPAEELLRTLRRLQAKRLVYLYEDKRKRAVRVGLGKILREG